MRRGRSGRYGGDGVGRVVVVWVREEMELEGTAKDDLPGTSEIVSAARRRGFWYARPTTGDGGCGNGGGAGGAGSREGGGSRRRSRRSKLRRWTAVGRKSLGLRSFENKFDD